MFCSFHSGFAANFVTTLMAQIGIIYGGMVTFLSSARAITHRSNFHNNSIVNWLLFQLSNSVIHFCLNLDLMLALHLRGKKKKSQKRPEMFSITSIELKLGGFFVLLFNQQFVYWNFSIQMNIKRNE